MKEKLIKSIRKTLKSFLVILPSILLIVFIISFLLAIIPKYFYSTIFTKNIWLDMFIGNIIGSISVGSPITSYIIGGELFTQGVSLLAVTTFLVSWVTVGFIQFPAEAIVFGKKFAIYRNIVSFFMSLIVAIITVFIFKLFNLWIA
jgi:uncharacterized membrane protein YraQ (UPF0718 family)